MKNDQNDEKENIIGEYDLSRNDKFYSLAIPDYHFEADVVYYEIHLKDLVYNKVYKCCVRFKAIKQFHQKLSSKPFQLPPFPDTHFWTFWTRTNKNIQKIEKRRLQLENYLNVVINEPFFRGYKEIKNFVNLIKKNSVGNEIQRLTMKVERISELTKSRSHSSGDNLKEYVDFKPPKQKKQVNK